MKQSYIFLGTLAALIAFSSVASLSFAASDARSTQPSNQVEDIATTLCEVAMLSPEELNQKARIVGISRRQLSKLECNGVPVLAFAKEQKLKLNGELVDSRNLANVE